MSSVLYSFEKLPLKKFENYLFQDIVSKTLTKVYHTHDFYEIILFLHGNGMQLINDKPLSFSENDIVILRPGDYHTFLSHSKDIHIISLSVKSDEFTSFCNIYGKEILNYGSPIIFSNQDLLSDLTVKCKNIFSVPDEYECKFLLSVILKYYTDFIFKKQTELPKNLLYALQEIKKPENLKGGTKEFIKLSNYSFAQLSRLMKKHLNTTIHDYILNLKLDFSYNALILTNDSIEKICDDAGYQSLSHFNKIFKDKYKTTPGALRKKHAIRTI